jgi:hypothetical protein
MVLNLRLWKGWGGHPCCSLPGGEASPGLGSTSTRVRPQGGGLCRHRQAKRPATVGQRISLVVCIAKGPVTAAQTCEVDAAVSSFSERTVSRSSLSAPDASAPSGQIVVAQRYVSRLWLDSRSGQRVYSPTLLPGEKLDIGNLGWYVQSRYSWALPNPNSGVNCRLFVSKTRVASRLRRTRAESLQHFSPC